MFARYSRDGSFTVLRRYARLDAVLAAGSITGTILGGLLLGIVPDTVLVPFLALLLILSSIKILATRRHWIGHRSAGGPKLTDTESTEPGGAQHSDKWHLIRRRHCHPDQNAEASGCTAARTSTSSANACCLPTDPAKINHGKRARTAEKIDTCYVLPMVPIG